MAIDPNPYAAPVNLAEGRSEALTDKVRGPRGLGGWLLAPLIYLFLGILHLVVRFDIWGLDTWQDAWDVLSRGFPSARWLVFMAVPFSDAALLMLTLVVLVFFFSKSRHTPRLMIARSLIRLSFALIEVLVMSPLIGTTQPVLLIQVLFGAVWIPYFMRSRRVKNTFVR